MVIGIKNKAVQRRLGIMLYIPAILFIFSTSFFESSVNTVVLLAQIYDAGENRYNLIVVSLQP